MKGELVLSKARGRGVTQCYLMLHGTIVACGMNDRRFKPNDRSFKPII